VCHLRRPHEHGLNLAMAGRALRVQDMFDFPLRATSLASHNNALSDPGLPQGFCPPTTPTGDARGKNRVQLGKLKSDWMRLALPRKHDRGTKFPVFELLVPCREEGISVCLRRGMPIRFFYYRPRALRPAADAFAAVSTRIQDARRPFRPDIWKIEGPGPTRRLKTGEMASSSKSPPRWTRRRRPWCVVLVPRVANDDKVGPVAGGRPPPRSMAFVHGLRLGRSIWWIPA